MKDKIRAILIVLVGVLLVLPLVGVDAIGTATEGILAWILAVAVLAIGIMKVLESFASQEVSVPVKGTV